MPAAAYSNLAWNGPCSAAMVVSDAVGTMQATASQIISPSLSVTGVGTVHVMRPYRCRNAALVAEGVGTLHHAAPKRWVRAGLEVSVNELTADDVAGALQTMKVNPTTTFNEAMNTILVAIGQGGVDVNALAAAVSAQVLASPRLLTTDKFMSLK